MSQRALRRTPAADTTRRQLAKPTERILLAHSGLAALGLACSAGGVTLIVGLVVLTGTVEQIGPALRARAIIGAVFIAIAIPVWIAICRRRQIRALHWLHQGAKPAEEDARRVAELPRTMAMVGGSIWGLGVTFNAVASISILSGNAAALAIALDIMGAFATTGFIYLLTDRLLRTAVPAIAAASPPGSTRAVTVGSRLAVVWMLSSGLPLIGVIAVLHLPGGDALHQTTAATILSVFGILGGVIATGVFARAVASPLRRLRADLDRVRHGNLDVTVEVDDYTEVGMLEASVNSLVETLRARDHIRNVLDRHVGAPVANRALNTPGFGGEILEVTALFVDVIGSTALAYRLNPSDFADALNSLWEVVITATDANQGMVNKFEGDAALCIFGAPASLPDSAAAALRTARAIRRDADRISVLDVGIGVSKGHVFAGDVGSPERQEYTVIGDAINEAARLTEIAKTIPSRILVSNNVVLDAHDDEQKHWSRYRDLTLRGRSEPTTAWLAMANDDND